MKVMNTKHNKEILFVIPASRFNAHRYSIAYLYLSSYLLSKGYDNSIVEPHNLLNKKFKFHDLDEENKKVIFSRFRELIINCSPKIVCFNCFTPEFMEIVKLIRIVKDNSSAKIIVGGPHPNAKPEEFLDYGADFSIYGEGEVTLNELVEVIYHEEDDLSLINGLCWNQGEKKIINPPRPPIEDISKLPLPAYDKIDMERYLSIWDGTVRGFPLRAATIITSRGCPFNCSFCGCNKVFGRRLRFRSEKDIEEEIKLLVDKYNIEAIMFFDDTLTVSKEHLIMVARIMKKYNLLWDCQGRVNSLNEELIKFMKKQGCVQIDFGVESGSQRVLDEIIRKKIKIEDTKKAFALCKKYGIHPMANMMLGLPTETRQEMDQTFELAKKINASYYFFSVVCPLPGTDLYDMIGIDVKPEEYYKLDWGRPEIEEFNRSEVKEIYKLRNKYYKDLSKIMFKNALLDLPNYFKIWWKLPRKVERLRYIGKKLYNYFIFRRITGRPLRL